MFLSCFVLWNYNKYLNTEAIAFETATITANNVVDVTVDPITITLIFTLLIHNL